MTIMQFIIDNFSHLSNLDFSELPLFLQDLVSQVDVFLNGDAPTSMGGDQTNG